MLQQALNAPHLKMRVKGIHQIKGHNMGDIKSLIKTIGTVSCYDGVRTQESSKCYQLQSPLCNQLEMQSTHSCYRLATLSLATAQCTYIYLPHSALHVRVDQVHSDLFLFQNSFRVYVKTKLSILIQEHAYMNVYRAG